MIGLYYKSWDTPDYIIMKVDKFNVFYQYIFCITKYLWLKVMINIFTYNIENWITLSLNCLPILNRDTEEDFLIFYKNETMQLYLSL